MSLSILPFEILILMPNCILQRNYQFSMGLSNKSEDLSLSLVEFIRSTHLVSVFLVWRLFLWDLRRRENQHYQILENCITAGKIWNWITLVHYVLSTEMQSLWQHVICIIPYKWWSWFLFNEIRFPRQHIVLLIRKNAKICIPW